MDLSPEERQRIYEEEKARREAGEQKQPSKKGMSGCAIFLIVAVAVLVLLFIVGSLGDSSSRSSPSRAGSGVRTLRGTYWCGRSFDDAGQIGFAVSRGDTAAVAGMIARGAAYQVEGGTRVVSGGEVDMGISLVHVDSGYHAGEKCYISTNVLE